MTDENLQACKTRCFSPIDSHRYCELDNIQVTHVGRQVLSDGKDLNPEEVLNELVSSTGAWKSWSSQFLFSKFYERVVEISIAGKTRESHSSLLAPLLQDVMKQSLQFICDESSFQIAAGFIIMTMALQWL